MAPKPLQPGTSKPTRPLEQISGLFPQKEKNTLESDQKSTSIECADNFQWGELIEFLREPYTKLNLHLFANTLPAFPWKKATLIDSCDLDKNSNFPGSFESSIYSAISIFSLAPPLIRTLYNIGIQDTETQSNQAIQRLGILLESKDPKEASYAAEALLELIKQNKLFALTTLLRYYHPNNSVGTIVREALEELEVTALQHIQKDAETNHNRLIELMDIISIINTDKSGEITKVMRNIDCTAHQSLVQKIYGPNYSSVSSEQREKDLKFIQAITTFAVSDNQTAISLVNQLNVSAIGQEIIKIDRTSNSNEELIIARRLTFLLYEACNLNPQATEALLKIDNLDAPELREMIAPFLNNMILPENMKERAETNLEDLAHLTKLGIFYGNPKAKTLIKEVDLKKYKSRIRQIIQNSPGQLRLFAEAAAEGNSSAIDLLKEEVFESNNLLLLQKRAGRTADGFVAFCALGKLESAPASFKEMAHQFKLTQNDGLLAQLEKDPDFVLRELFPLAQDGVTSVTEFFRTFTPNKMVEKALRGTSNPFPAVYVLTIYENSMAFDILKKSSSNTNATTASQAIEALGFIATLAPERDMKEKAQRYLKEMSVDPLIRGYQKEMLEVVKSQKRMDGSDLLGFFNILDFLHTYFENQRAKAAFNTHMTILRATNTDNELINTFDIVSKGKEEIIQRITDQESEFRRLSPEAQSRFAFALGYSWKLLPIHKKTTYGREWIRYSSMTGSVIMDIPERFIHEFITNQIQISYPGETRVDREDRQDFPEPGNKPTGPTNFVH